MLQIDCLDKCDRRDLWVKDLDPGRVEAAISERGDSHRLDACVSDVRRAGQLPRDDAEIRAWSMEVGCPRLARTERRDEIEQIRIKRPLTIECLWANVLRPDVDLSTWIYYDSGSSILSPELEVQILKRCERLSNCRHGRCRNMPPLVSHLALAKPVDRPEAHQVCVRPQL